MQMQPVTWVDAGKTVRRVRRQHEGATPSVPARGRDAGSLYSCRLRSSATRPTPSSSPAEPGSGTYPVGESASPELD